MIIESQSFSSLLWPSVASWPKGVQLAFSQSFLSEKDLDPQALLLYQALPSQRRRQSWLLGRGALAQFVGVSGLTRDELLCLTFPHPQFSLSHARTWAVAGFSNVPESVGFGVDLEYARPVAARSLKHFLTQDELQMLSSSGSVDMTEQLVVQMWTLKEAAFKATPSNEGLVFTDIQLALSPENEWIGKCAVRGLRYEFWIWNFQNQIFLSTACAFLESC